MQWDGRSSFFQFFFVNSLSNLSRQGWCQSSAWGLPPLRRKHPAPCWGELCIIFGENAAKWRYSATFFRHFSPLTGSCSLSVGRFLIPPLVKIQLILSFKPLLLKCLQMHDLLCCSCKWRWCQCVHSFILQEWVLIPFLLNEHLPIFWKYTTEYIIFCHQS